MSSNYLKPSNAGIYQINALNVDTLWINGVPIQTLIGAGGLTEAEVAELKTLAARIDVTGLTAEWIVNDANRNAALKSLIDGHTTTLDAQAIAIGTATSVGGGNTAAITGLTSTVGGHTTLLATHTAQIAGNEAAIGVNAGNIASNTTAIAAAGVSISAAAAAIAANTANITTNTNNIATNTSNISSNSSAITQAQTNIIALGNAQTASGLKNGRITCWNFDGTPTLTSNSVTGIKDGTGFAIALGNGSADQNGIYCYKNGYSVDAQIRIETENQKQLYLRGGNVLIYAGNDGSNTARNLVRVGAESDHVQIGTLTDALRFPLVTIGTDNGLASTTNMRGRWYFPTGVSVYDSMVRASGIVGPENGRLSTTTSPYFSGLSVIDPIGSIGLTAILGAITLNALVGGIVATTTTGAISYQTGAGAVTISTGAGAVSIQTGAGPVNISSGGGKVNVTTIADNVYIGAGKGALGTAGELQLRAHDKITISPDGTTEIDKTGYMEMADGSAPATTTRKLYHTSSELYYSGTKLSNQTSAHNVKELTAGSNVTITSTSGNYTINANASSTPTLATVMAVGNSAGSNVLNMNSQNITSVGTITATAGVITTVSATTVNATTIVPMAITGWNVKSIVAGTNVTVSNASGAVTINASGGAASTGLDVGASYIVNSIATLPSKPYWYGTVGAWLNTGNTTYLCNDAWVSATGQYQMFATGTATGSVTQYCLISKDWGVSYQTGNVLSVGSGVCGSNNGEIMYYSTRIVGATQGRIYKSTFTSDTNYGQTFAVLSSSANLDYSKMACSRDGKYVLAGSYSSAGGILQLSSNYGSTWTGTTVNGTVAGTSVYGVGMSGDGKYQFAVTTSVAPRYSTDYGATWNSSTGVIDNNSAQIGGTRIKCSITGQIVCLTNNSSFGVFMSYDYGATFTNQNNGTTILATDDICMSANGQFIHRAYYTGKVSFSENYGRTWYAAATLAVPSGVTASLSCIACSDTAGYVITGANNASRTYAIYDTPNDVKQLVAGLNITVVPNGFGTYTINSSAGNAGLEAIPFYIGSFNLNASAGNVITLPEGINLQNYDIDMRFEAMLANSGTASYTFFTINYNESYQGKTQWTNQIHANGEFATAGSYSQSYLNPVFAYIPQYDSGSSIQYVSSKFYISKDPYETTAYTPVITRFWTAVGAQYSSSVRTDNSRFQDQVGHIQSTQSGGTTAFPTISKISISQYGGAGTFRSSYSGTPAQIVLYLKRKIP